MNHTYRFLILAFISFLIPTYLTAQDQGISYQAIVRNDGGNILQNQNVTLEFDILRAQANGPVVFTESVTTTTDDFGLVNLVIGQQNSEQFEQIDWGSASYFLSVSLNGTQIGGVREFQAVPYSKVATDMVLDQLTDVQVATAANGNVLVFQGGTWQPGEIESIVYTPGDGISIVGNVISNTAPDQTVVLNEGNNIDITGAYPNFTIASTAAGGTTYTSGTGIDINNNNVISNTAPDQTVVLNEGNNIDITGSYPNFTIASTAVGGVNYTAGTGIAINNNNVISNTEPDQTVVLNEGNNIDITGTYPNFTIAATVGGGNSLWSSSGNTIFYNSGSIAMGKTSAINGLNVNNIQYLPTGNLLDVNLPVNIRGNVFITHDFGNGNFGLSLRNNQIPNRLWTMHVAANDPIGPVDGSLNFLYNGDGKIRFTTDGSVQIDGQLTQGSDVRFKSDISDVNSILPKALQLQLTQYQMIQSSIVQFGYLAQEVAKVFPELVSYNDDNDRYYLNYQAFGPIALESIKEQQKIIDDQKERIDELEERIRKLEQLIIKE